MRGRRTALALALVAAATALPARAQTVPRVLVASASVPMLALPSTATSVVAWCGSGTALLSGGMLAGRADSGDPVPPSVALRGKGSYPSDVNAVPVPDGATDPAAWSATANFALESEFGDQITSLALCTTRTLDQRVVVSRSVNAPIQAGVSKVTVTCPPGTLVVGGGGEGTPPGSRALKPVGMYPSDASGNMLPHDAPDATSWTAVGSTPEGGSTNATTAYAICAGAVGLATRVARVDAPGPLLPRTSTTATVDCGADSLIGGGALVDTTTGIVQQGVHLKGSYPSDLSGLPAVAGTADPAAWSAIVSTGGQISLNSFTHVFALCIVEAGPPPAVEPGPPVV